MAAPAAQPAQTTSTHGRHADLRYVDARIAALAADCAALARADSSSAAFEYRCAELERLVAQHGLAPDAVSVRGPTRPARIAGQPAGRRPTGRALTGSAQTVARLATQQPWPDAIARRLIRALIPRATVPEGCVLEVIGRICARKLPVPTSMLLLKWLILVYDIIDSKTRLHRLYGVIFHFIEFDTLRCAPGPADARRPGRLAARA